MPVVTAFSVSEQITNVGAYAGLASILGLAVLSLLYFGQARELKRLRDWAGRAPERTAELQEQANQQAATSAARRPAPQAAGVPASRPAAATSASGSVRAVPATQAATAAGAATASPAASQAPPVPGTPAPSAPGPGTPPPGATPEGRPVTWAPSQAPAPGAPADGAGQDTQAIPAIPPAPADIPLPEAVPSVAASVPIGPDGPPTDDNPVPLRQINAAAGTGQPRRRTAPEPAASAAPQRSRDTDGPRGRRVGLLAGGAVVLLLVIVLATQVLGGGGGTPSKKASTENTIVPPATSTTTGAASAVNPGDYQVYVLNGTIQNGIAAEFAKTLETAGYQSAGTGNAAVNTVPTTEVFYVAGKKKGATAVAKKLGVKAASVKPADPNVTALAQGADVIIQIGADKATP